MSRQEKINLKIEALEQMVGQLSDVIQAGVDEHRFLIDATMRRFKLSFELFRKRKINCT